MASENYSLLRTINSPADLKKLSIEQLVELSRELREFLINTVSKTSGHFASGLGVVELTIAIHYVFDAPNDQIIWDVGHQAYAYKLLTEEKISSIHSVNMAASRASLRSARVNMMLSEWDTAVLRCLRHSDYCAPRN